MSSKSTFSRTDLNLEVMLREKGSSSKSMHSTCTGVGWKIQKFCENNKEIEKCREEMTLILVEKPKDEKNRNDR